ncbi:MAG: hypothetical protein LC785_05480, partial [Acidobacteria bacterium]|nr:hypothetical protein [Acidobacteriota bacterium]MCA1641404.1 hypothetical protein [Acidobacteriota bacterium]
ALSMLLGVQIYAVGLADNSSPSFACAANHYVLQRLSSASGGKAYYPPITPPLNALNEFIDRVAVRLRHQYVIGFSPETPVKHSEVRKVEIKVIPPVTMKKTKLYAQSSEGYVVVTSHN